MTEKYIVGPIVYSEELCELVDTEVITHLYKLEQYAEFVNVHGLEKEL